VNRDRKREADRAFARRKAALARGEDPARVDGHPRSPARIRLPRAAVPLILQPACQHAAPELFFSAAPEDIAAAIAICRGCPGRLPCLAGAVERGEVFGVWGGVDFDREHVREESVA